METQLAVTQINKRSVMTFIDADTVNGNSFSNDGKTWIAFRNAQATMAATISVNATIDDIVVPARTESVNVGDVLIVGPFRPDVYNDSNGNVTFAVSGAVQVCLVSPS